MNIFGELQTGWGLGTTFVKTGRVCAKENCAMMHMLEDKNS
jgi:hypothetical protein